MVRARERWRKKSMRRGMLAKTDSNPKPCEASVTEEGKCRWLQLVVRVTCLALVAEDLYGDMEETDQ